MNSFVTSMLSTNMTTPDKISWQHLPAMHSVKEAKGLPGTVFYSWFARYPVLLEKMKTLSASVIWHLEVARREYALPSCYI